MNFCAVFLKRNPKCNFDLCQTCHLSTSLIHLNKSREARVMNKLAGNSSKKRRSWQPEISSSNIVGNIAKRTVGKQHLQRLTVLNHMFMENITGILSTNDLAEKLHGFNLEITEVKISTDLNFLNVYWCCSGLKDAATLAENLNAIASPLRHELSQSQLMGNVPRIVFVRDVRNDHLNLIDELLKQADYGEDFTPCNPTLFNGIDLPKSAEALAFEASEEGKKAAEARLRESRQEQVEKLMALQKHQVLNLDHQTIMNRIKGAVNKSKAPHRRNLTYGEVMQEVHPEQNLAAIEDRIAELKSSELKDFLTERKKALLRDQRLQAREEKRRPESKLRDADEEERIRKEFTDDGSNYHFRDSSDNYRDSMDDYR